MFPQKSDNLNAINQADKIVKRDWDIWIKESLIPLEEIPKDTRGSLSAKIYLNQWHRLLNSRQKLLFVTILQKIHEFYKKNPLKINENQLEATVLYLSFIFGKHLPYNCRSASWHRTRDIVASTLSQRGVGMMWDHVEVNPFIKGSDPQTINSAI